MAGRNRTPANIIEFSGNVTHKRSKADIELRKQSEIHLGTNVIACPDSVLSDARALEKWHYLMALYDGFAFVTSADVDIFAQYCLCYSELTGLQNARSEIVKSHEALGLSAYLSMRILKGLGLDTEINNKSALLQRIGAKIFLDPTSRVKAIPLPKKEKLPDTPLSQFGNI